MENFLHKQAAAKECILCGRCLEACPLFAATAREELGPRAKHQLDRARRQGLLPLARVKDLAALCLACGRCEAACPQGLCAPDLVAGLRAAHPGIQEWLWKTWMLRGAPLWPALAWICRAAPAKSRAGHLAAMAPAERIAPWLAVEPLRQVWEGASMAAIFPGCLASRVRKDWTRKAEALLAMQGLGVVEEPEWACCGCTVGHAGLAEEQRAAQEQNLDAWRKAGRPRIVVFCATCQCGLRAYAREPALPWTSGEAVLWQQSVVPLSSLLENLRFTVLENAPVRVHYHRPCHGSGHKAGRSADQAFLQEILGERLHIPKDGPCCGMGGLMQLGAPGLCAAVAERCWSAYGGEAGEQLLTGCSGCVLQLTATAPAGLLAGHWLDVVDV